jgi:hypothetical protein
MVHQKKTILLRAPGRRRVVSAYEDDYLIVRDFIYSVLVEEKEILIIDLIGRAHKHLADKIVGDLGWYILNVKQDMESKGLIKNVHGSASQKFPMIRLSKKRGIGYLAS